MVQYERSSSNVAFSHSAKLFPKNAVSSIALPAQHRGVDLPAAFYVVVYQWWRQLSTRFVLLDGQTHAQFRQQRVLEWLEKALHARGLVQVHSIICILSGVGKRLQF